MDREIKLFIAVSIDGYIADKAGGVGWLVGEAEGFESDYGYEKFYSEVDTVIMGRRTYDQVSGELFPGRWPYGGKMTYVMTNRPAEPARDVEFTDEPVAALIRKLKEEQGKTVWICGGADIVRQLLKEDLIDEYQISWIPVILGEGVRLFDSAHSAIPLSFVGTDAENGILNCTYRRRGDHN